MVATIRSSVRDGFNAVRISRRTGRRGLSPGRYAAVVTLTDAYGARSSSTASFTVGR